LLRIGELFLKVRELAYIRFLITDLKLFSCFIVHYVLLKFSVVVW